MLALLTHYRTRETRSCCPILLPSIGISGLFPIHPKTFVRARHNRENKTEEKVCGDIEEETFSKKQVRVRVVQISLTMIIHVRSALSSDCFILLLYHISLVCLCDRCYNNVNINYDETLFTSDSVYSVLGTSRACVDSYEAKFHPELEYELPVCPVGLLSVDLGPIARFDDNNRV
ncbi:hypothetical protein ANCCAN_10580 [Ancylostoma caninum]|uniref:Uncharacterized protein n=1 Tax=Ancylostoma caninum TaxID=29170 RepID=A0A368GGD6_ANCCA|nr:hypothetical protein ANCCAN_10580 [Ancylostoma caninum]